MKPRTAVVPLALVALLALSACATPTTPVPPASSESPAPSASEEPAPASTPTVRFDLGCDDIGAMVDMNSLVTDTVTQRDPLVAYSEASGDLPYLSYLDTMGGLSCEWSNGAEHSHSHGTPEIYAGVTVSILPSPGPHWATYVDYYGVVDDRQTHCNSAECGLEQLVGDYWISVAMASPTASTEPAWFVTLADAVAALDPPAPAWQAPTHTTPLGGDCDSIIPVADVEAALGLSPLTAEGPHGGWSQWASARLLAGGSSCIWYTDGFLHAGGMAWLPGGAWAAARSLEASSLPGPAESLTVPGLAPDDGATIRCEADNSHCIVDLVLGGSWLQFGLFTGGPYAPLPEGIRTSAAALAEAIVARVG